MQKKHLGLLLMICAAAMMATSILLMKTIPQLTSLLPKDVAIWRFSIAAPAAWLFYSLRRGKKPLLPNHFWRFVLLGGVFSIASFCAVFALERLSSSIYIITVYIYPSLVVLYSLFTGRSIPKFYWLGLPLTFVGLFLVAFDRGAAISIDPLGFVITIVNAFAMAAYVLLSEKFFEGVDNKILGTNWMMLGAMTAGLIMILPLGLQAPENAMGWILILSLGIVGTFLPILLINIGLQLLGAARGSVIITLQPVFTVVLSNIFLGETLTLQQWLGGILVIIAIVLLQLRSVKKVPKEHEAHSG